ncbi:MAG: hypothetical protein ABH834_04860 [Candidatus Altiarchaeota archaeon]
MKKQKQPSIEGIFDEGKVIPREDHPKLEFYIETLEGRKKLIIDYPLNRGDEGVHLLNSMSSGDTVEVYGPFNPEQTSRNGLWVKKALKMEVINVSPTQVRKKGSASD